MNPDARARSPLPELPFPDDGKAERQSSFAITDDPLRDAYWEWCPNCGSRLHNERCKRRCPRCHYFMSCADFD